MKYSIYMQSFLTLFTLALLILSGMVTLAPALAEAATAASASNNWAGYVSSNTAYTGVGATWNIPVVSTSASDVQSADATWVGIGGMQSNNLIQAGTQALVENGSVSYAAWFETLPQSEQVIPLEVHANDQVSVALSEIKPNLWQLVFTNDTTGKQYINTILYVSNHESADWIEEMPMKVTNHSKTAIALDQFGTATFSDAYAITNGMRVAIGQTNATPLVMVGGHSILAQASDLNASGTGFSVARGSVNDTIATTDSNNYVTAGVPSTSTARYARYIIRRTYSQLPSSILTTTSSSTNMPQPQYTVTNGNGYRVLQVSWSF